MKVTDQHGNPIALNQYVCIIDDSTNNGTIGLVDSIFPDGLIGITLENDSVTAQASTVELLSGEEIEELQLRI